MAVAHAGGETPGHRELKRLALVWAQAHGFASLATEVRLPRSGFRADVAGCADADALGLAGETAVFECKQSRADLLRDAAPERLTGERLRVVVERRRELEEMLGLHLPNLRRGESLFAECDAYDLESIRHDGLHSLRREERILQSKLYGGTKFDRLRRYRCADRCYLVVAPDVVAPHESPEGWGLLVREADALRLIRRPERIDSGETARRALLQAVAHAATRAVNAGFGIDFDAVEAVRRETPPPG